MFPGRLTDRVRNSYYFGLHKHEAALAGDAEQVYNYMRLVWSDLVPIIKLAYEEFRTFHRLDNCPPRQNNKKREYRRERKQPSVSYTHLTLPTTPYV